MRLIIIILLFFSFEIMAYELVVVQSISKSNQTFVTRVGKKHGIFIGKRGTFTSENVSVIAKAITVTREYTQWEIESQIADVPFVKGQIITYYDATEYLWALNPEETKQKYIKKYVHKPRKSLEAHTALTRGITESVSGTDVTSSTRGGMQFEVFVENEINRNLSFAVGGRYEQEIINVDVASLTTTRAMLLADIRYYFEKLEEFYEARFFLGLGAGFGQSLTETTGSSSSGTVTLLPAVKAGLVLPIDKSFEFIFNTAFESLGTRETLSDNIIQTTNQTNYKLGGALKFYF